MCRPALAKPLFSEASIDKEDTDRVFSAFHSQDLGVSLHAEIDPEIVREDPLCYRVHQYLAPEGFDPYLAFEPAHPDADRGPMIEGPCDLEDSRARYGPGSI